MFCPQCGHQQVSNDTRFCSRCGLALGMTDLISANRNQLQREKRELTGVGLTMATVVMLLNFLLVFGLVTLPHLKPAFLWIWLSFMFSSLVVGGFGLVNLVRADFFKKLKQREALLSLMKAEQNRQVLPDEAGILREDSRTTPLLTGAASVTEVTTRELDLVSKPDKRELP